MILFSIVSLLLLQICNGQDLSYPEYDDSQSNPNEPSLEDIQIVLNFDECKANMTKYVSSSDDSETVCDCKPDFIYYPPNDSCYLPYRQGPCCCHEYLVYDPKTQVTSCQWNPCAVDGYVPYNGYCYQLDIPGFPCVAPESLSVDENFEINCIVKMLQTRVLFVAPLKMCPAGSRRNARGLCRNVISK